MILHKNIYLKKTVNASVNKQQVMVNKKHFQANHLLDINQILRELFEMQEYAQF